MQEILTYYWYRGWGGVNDLKKSLPKIPIAESVEDFIEFSEAGRKLAAQHFSYENMSPCAQVQVKGAENGNFIVHKMKFGGRQGAWDKSRIIFNSEIEPSHISLRAYDYVVNGRSAVEWIMESYKVKSDKDAGIKNDPNDWTGNTISHAIFLTCCFRSSI